MHGIKTLPLVICFLAVGLLVQAQTDFEIKGTVKTAGIPLVGATVNNKTTQKRAVTDKNGEFKIRASVGDVLQILYVGYDNFETTVVDDKDLDIRLNMSTHALNDVVVTGFANASMNNYWVGAKIGYNFLGDDTRDFFVGSASISINLLDLDKGENTLGIVGNIGNFKFNNDSSENKKIQQLTQSINGLQVGIGYTHDRTWSAARNIKHHFRQFLLVGPRLSTYTNVGQDSSTVNLPQFVVTGGLEYELEGFRNGGTMDFSTGLSYLAFDKGNYFKVFNEIKSHLIALDVSAILPLSKNLGFFINGTFSKHTDAVYIIGVIVKAAK